MKKLTKAILIVAILNLLAVLAGAGWLFATGRLNESRMVTMTDLFSEPVAIEEAKLKAEQAEIDKALAEQERPLPDIPLNSQERNLVRVEMTQIDRQRLDRMKKEVDNLQATLRRERRAVEIERQSLQKEKEDFEQMRLRLAGLEGGKQFKKSLNSISGMKAKDAKTILSALLGESKDEEVVSYLSAMDDRIRTQILTEFVKAGEDQLAANLLESLRLRGLETASDSENSE
jgi:hypothetical protein